MPKHILSKRIIRYLARDEAKTKARYQYLGRHYHIPALIKAGSQEGGHNKLFKRLLKSKRRK
jgi:hypothetical protein